MYYYEAPNICSIYRPKSKSLFLAGGITGCPDWQFELREKLIDTDLTVFNPRRKNFPIDDPNAAQAQIAWEHQQLHAATAISFWFPCETMCPIVLFELGAWSHYGAPCISPMGSATTKHKPIFVGVHPDYQRRQDVIIQLGLQRPDVEIVDNLNDLAMQIVQWDGETD